jgi:hypothetical protein
MAVLSETPTAAFGQGGGRKGPMRRAIDLLRGPHVLEGKSSKGEFEQRRPRSAPPIYAFSRGPPRISALVSPAHQENIVPYLTASQKYHGSICPYR